MKNNKRYLRLKRLLNPGSIVFVGGAALKPVIGYTRALGFKGSYHVINPRRERLCGIDCVRSATELKNPPDIAFVAVPAAAAIEAVADLAQAGVGAAIVNSSGFAETGEAGSILEARLLKAAGKMPLIGPNCPGIASFLDRFGANWAVATFNGFPGARKSGINGRSLSRVSAVSGGSVKPQLSAKSEAITE